MRQSIVHASLTLALCGAGVLLAGCDTFGGSRDAGGPAAAGGSASAGTASAQAPVAAQDRDFVMRAAQSGMAEVQASQLAVTQASSEEVRAFAQRMVRDHTATNEELMRLARTKSIDVPAQLDAEHRAKVDALRGLSGPQFEQAYLQDMGVRAHQDAVALFQREAQNGADEDLRAFASRTLLALREHLAMAEQAAAVAAK
jgi:putative membrane protein